jgi:hypothetical protein
VPGAPGMNVYPKIATKQEANHAEVTDFHCLLWPATSVQPCRFILLSRAARKKDNPSAIIWIPKEAGTSPLILAGT